MDEWAFSLLSIHYEYRVEVAALGKNEESILLSKAHSIVLCTAEGVELDDAPRGIDTGTVH